MLIPGTAGQVLAVVLLILPGFVFTTVRSRLRGPTPADGDIGIRILTSIAFGLVLDALYVLIFGRALTGKLFGHDAAQSEIVRHPRLTTLAAVGLLVVVPATAAWLDDLRTTKKWLAWLRYDGRYDPTPTAWDFAGPTHGGGVFVRVRQPSGAWVGGWIGDDSFTSTWPEPHDLFIETQWRMSEDGAFDSPIPQTRGVYVSCPEGTVVEWIDPPPASENPDRNQGDPNGDPSSSSERDMQDEGNRRPANGQ